MSLALTFDIIVCALLLATIVYAVILNRKLSIIQNSRGELQSLLTHFTTSLARAEEGIRELKKVANLVGSDLDHGIKKGAALKDDLVYLIERGDTTANRLEDTVREVRTPSDVKSKPVESIAKIIKKTPEPSEKEQKILKALSGLR